MRTLRPARRRLGRLPRAPRGGAVIELLLALPLFLLPFPLFLLDFSRASVEQDRALMAAKHVAWQGGRNVDDGTQPAPPSPSEVGAKHYYHLTGPDLAVLAEEDTSWAYWGALLLNTRPSSTDDTSWNVGILDGLMEIGRAFPKFVIGELGLSHGRVRHDATGFWLARHPSFQGDAYAIMRTAREDHPMDPEGWFDPIQRATRAISDAF